MEAVTHLEKVITGEVSAVTHLEKVIAQETSAVTYTEKVIAGEATPITHLQKVIAGVASPVTHLEQVWAGGSPTPSEHEYTGAVPVTITADGTPLLDYTIYGNTVQNGTPTPDNPIMPQSCGELERSGEHSGQYKIPISSGGTTTPVYLGEVETTRRVKKLVLDGVNDGEWKKSSARTGSFYLTVGTNAIVALGLCDRAINVDTIQQYDSIGKMFIESNGSGPLKLINLWLFDTNISLDDFKSYLAAQYTAGTPVTVWYVLATPTTGIVNEPLRKIGDYADTLSMEQAGVSIPTLNGQTVIDVETTLKPSEMYIKYNG